MRLSAGARAPRPEVLAPRLADPGDDEADVAPSPRPIARDVDHSIRAAQPNDTPSVRASPFAFAVRISLRDARFFALAARVVVRERAMQ